MVTLGKIRSPFVVGVVVERDATAAARATASAFHSGADAVELNLAGFRRDPGPAFWRAVAHPVYTSLRRAPFMAVYGAKFGSLAPQPDERRMERQLAQLVFGSAGLDIEADTFDPTADEWTVSRRAIRRQEAIAGQAHSAGAAVIFSWHPPRKVTYGEASRAVRALRQRGATYVKIVERVGSRDEALDSIAISLRLRDEVGGGLVFLGLGAEAVRFRPYMAAFGASYVLARPSFGSNRLSAQPLVVRARALVDLS